LGFWILGGAEKSRFVAGWGSGAGVFLARRGYVGRF
jgi:hypothetical protein